KRGETASIFLPSVPTLLALAGELEAERDHALDRPSSGEQDPEDLFAAEDAELERARREEKASDELMLPGFEALEAQASFDKVLYDGGEFGMGGDVGSEEEQEFLGIPGLLDADQVTTLLRSRQAGQVSS